MIEHDKLARFMTLIAAGVMKGPMAQQLPHIPPLALIGIKTGVVSVISALAGLIAREEGRSEEEVRTEFGLNADNMTITPLREATLKKMLDHFCEAEALRSKL